MGSSDVFQGKTPYFGKLTRLSHRKTLTYPLQKGSNRKERYKHVNTLNLRFNYLHLRIKCLQMKSVIGHRKVNTQIFSKSLFPSIQFEIRVIHIFPEIS